MPPAKVLRVSDTDEVNTIIGSFLPASVISKVIKNSLRYGIQSKCSEMFVPREAGNLPNQACGLVSDD